MLSRRVLFALVILSLVILVTATACSTKDKIIGTWQQPGAGGLTIAFVQGGTLISGTGSNRSIGTYRFLDDKNIMLEMPLIFGFGTSSAVYEVAIDGDTMTLSTPGMTLKFNRVK